MATQNSYLCSDCHHLTLDPQMARAAAKVTDVATNIESMIPLTYNVLDNFPELPKLRASMQAGCQMCRFLENVIRCHVRTTPELRDLANKAMKADKRDTNLANLEIEIDLSECHNSSMSLRFGSGPESWIPSHMSGTIRVGRISEPLRIEMRDKMNGFYEFFPNQDPLSNDSIQLVHGWLSRCMETQGTAHQYCPKRTKASAPLRLLDVMQGNTVRLVETQGLEIQYVILSYCWGTSPAVLNSRTVVSNLTTRMSGFPMKSLPQTLQDSVTLVRRLGFVYIWIDALCIVQDSGEWVTESTRMMDNYENAYFTMIPVTCTSADQGFLRPRPSWAAEIINWPVTRNTQIQFHYPDYRPTDQDIESSVWLSRGWTFQERLLSARSIFIGRHAMGFECRGGWGDETTRFDVPANPGTDRLLPISSIQKQQSGEWNQVEMIRSKWYQFLELYTGRKLTYESDRLLALSGVMSKFQQLFGNAESYLDGFWKNDLWRGLLWKLPHGKSATKTSSFPSWSWCSVNQPLVWDDGAGLTTCAELVEFRGAPQKGRPDQGTNLARLIVRTWSFPITLLNMEMPPEIDVMVYLDDGSDTIDTIKSDSDVMGIVFTTYHHGQEPENWIFYPSSTPHDISGLIISPTEERSDGGKVFQRLGTFEVARELESVKVQNDDDEYDYDLVPVPIEDFESTSAASIYKSIYRSKRIVVLA